MKNLIYLLVAVLLFLGCERSLVEPTYEDPIDLGKSEITDENFGPKKSYTTVDFVGQYNFDPNDPSKRNGDFLNKSRPKYSYETERERYLKNLRLYTPGVISVGDKNYKVVNVYNINKHEILSKKGSVKSGRTWGDFTIHLATDTKIKEDERTKKHSPIETVQLAQQKLGPVILSGKFDGEINGKRIKVNLNGQGHNQLSGAKLVGAELMQCGGKFCWKSKSKGQIIKVDWKDE